MLEGLQRQSNGVRPNWCRQIVHHLRYFSNLFLSSCHIVAFNFFISSFPLVLICFFSSSPPLCAPSDPRVLTFFPRKGPGAELAALLEAKKPVIATVAANDEKDDPTQVLFLVFVFSFVTFPPVLIVVEPFLVICCLAFLEILSNF
jgi:hypothetical protein